MELRVESQAVSEVGDDCQLEGLGSANLPHTLGGKSSRRRLRRLLLLSAYGIKALSQRIH
jgi:hypothetical protein